MVLSAFHPELAASGIEANFQEGQVEYRLGAQRHTVTDYLDYAFHAGFRDLRWVEHRGDTELAQKVPGAEKYLGQPMVLFIEGSRPRS